MRWFTCLRHRHFTIRTSGNCCYVYCPCYHCKYYNSQSTFGLHSLIHKRASLLAWWLLSISDLNSFCFLYSGIAELDPDSGESINQLMDGESSPVNPEGIVLRRPCVYPNTNITTSTAGQLRRFIITSIAFFHSGTAVRWGWFPCDKKRARSDLSEVDLERPPDPMVCREWVFGTHHMSIPQCESQLLGGWLILLYPDRD